MYITKKPNFCLAPCVAKVYMYMLRQKINEFLKVNITCCIKRVYKQLYSAIINFWFSFS